MSGALNIVLRAVAVAVSDMVCDRIINHAEEATAALAEQVETVSTKIEAMGMALDRLHERQIMMERANSL